jgi:hypothetical protein
VAGNIFRHQASGPLITGPHWATRRALADVPESERKSDKTEKVYKEPVGEGFGQGQGSERVPCQGRAAQFDRLIAVLSAGIERLKLPYDGVISSFASEFNLCRYTMGRAATAKREELQR